MPTTRKRTRKPRPSAIINDNRITCKVCESAYAELGSICNDCNETLNEHEALYASALMGNAAARKAIKKLSRTERQRIVPPMLAEDDIESFIAKGIITGRHQATLRTVRLSGREPAIVQRTIQTKENTVKATTTPKTSRRTRKPAVDKPVVEQPKPSTRKRPSGKKATPAKAVQSKPAPSVKTKTSTELTAASVAKAADIDGRKFRKFLRSIGIKPSTKAEFSRAVKQYKAQSK